MITINQKDNLLPKYYVEWLKNNISKEKVQARIKKIKDNFYHKLVLIIILLMSLQMLKFLQMGMDYFNKKIQIKMIQKFKIKPSETVIENLSLMINKK